MQHTWRRSSPRRGSARRDDALSFAQLYRSALQLRSVLAVALVALALALPMDDRLLIAGLLALIIVPYTAALALRLRKTGRISRAMAVGDQVLCAGFVVVWPELLTGGMVVGSLAVSISAVLLKRRDATRGAVVGGLLFLALPGLHLALGDPVPPGYTLSAGAYATSAVITVLLVGTVTGRIRRSQRHLSQLLDELNVVVYEFDVLTRRVSYISPHVLPLTGYRAEDLLRSPRLITDMVHRDDVRTVLKLVDTVAGGGGSQAIEYRILTASGQQKWVANTASVELDGAGRPVTLRGTMADITREKEAELALYRQAHTDALTGLPNRTRLLEVVGEAIAGGVAGQWLLAFLDVDAFKRINDSLGHAAGDCLAVQVGQRLSERVRAGDCVARLGGDEFVVLLQLDDGDPAAVVRRLLTVFDAPFVLDGQEVRVTASAGAVVLDEETAASSGALTPSSLLEQADAAMYTAKATGPGRYAFYDTRMRHAALERLTLENDLRAALADGQLALVFQPIFEADGRTVAGYETLSRWTHPVRGPVSPPEFIEIAERSGTIVELGRWALREACLWHSRLPADHRAATRMNVNVSPRQLTAPTFVADVQAALAAAGMPGDRLCLEITESALIDDPDQALSVLQALRALGVSIALDDFGTGFSSLSLLHHYPVDVIKIDKAFVGGVTDPTSRDWGIVTAILGLAAHLGLAVVAEGVETLEQAETLQRLRCGFLQGYALGRPQPTPVTTALPAGLPAPRAAVREQAALSA